jgi:hypothetical protein
MTETETRPGTASDVWPVGPGPWPYQKKQLAAVRGGERATGTETTGKRIKPPNKSVARAAVAACAAAGCAAALSPTEPAMTMTQLAAGNRCRSHKYGSSELHKMSRTFFRDTVTMTHHQQVMKL